MKFIMRLKLKMILTLSYVKCVIDGIDYVDTGDFSDEIAGDGVYTS
jgi:hypothetical protein